MQLPWKALVLRFGPEASDAAALVVGVEGQVQADGIVDAVDETHSGIGLFLHVVSPFASCIIVIDAGSGQTSPLLCSGHIASWERALLWAGSCI